MNRKEFIDLMHRKENIVTININALTTDELKQLAAMLYKQGKRKECRDCNNRRAWLEYS